MPLSVAQQLAMGSPAYNAEDVPIDKFIPYDKNPRQHSADQIDLIAQSIGTHGVVRPIIIDEHFIIIAGHAIWLAGKKLGLTSMPATIVRGWSEAKKRGFRILDNQLVLKGRWDLDLLRVELNDLKIEGFNLPSLGFDLDELSLILSPPGTEGLTDPDAVPVLGKDPISRVGDTWLLGPYHRVSCGDSTDRPTVERLLAGAKPPLMVADPPYGVSYNPAWREMVDGANTVSKGKVLNDDRADWELAYQNFPGDAAYVWHGALQGDVVAKGLRAADFIIRAQIVWAKPTLVFGRGDYHWQHETCFYAVRKGAPSHWSGDRKQSTLWEIPNNGAFRGGKREQTWGHGTQKPIECMRRPIINNSKPGAEVYDPFLGTGTTLIAAEMTGRICYGLELSPVYVDVIVRRWQEFTGRKATLEATGKTFDAVATDSREANHV